MSRLRELIAKLCPDGVEYRALGEVGTFTKGRGLQKKDFSETGIGCIHYGQIYTRLGIVAIEPLTYVSPEKAPGFTWVEPNDIVIAVTSENVDDVCKAVVWRGKDRIVTGAHAVVFHPFIDSMYVAYYLQTHCFNQQKIMIVDGVKVIEMKIDRLAKVRIPVPPIEVQREIVRILDSFQELDDALTAEIEAREKQFEWMLQEELSISHLNRVESNTVEMRAVRDVREKVITPIRAKPTDFVGTIPWCKLEDVVGYEIGDSLSGKSVSEETVASMGLNVYPEGTVLCSCSATLGVYCVTQKPLVTNQRFMGFVCGDEILNRFFMYAMDASTTKLLMQATTGTNAYISRKAFEDHLIPVPTIGIQKRVVEELDSAYHLLNSLRSTREARRKQFAYYRDKLLAFPKRPREVDE